MGFKPWKDRLHKEIEDLNLDPSQELEILAKRTSGLAKKVVERTRYLEMECSPERALDQAWNELQKQFQSPYLPSQELLYHLLNGPTITSSTHSALFAFAQECNIMAEIQRMNPTSLPSLEEQTTQDQITNRLDGELNIKWHEFKCIQLHSNSTTPFHKFAKWITNQAEVQLG